MGNRNILIAVAMESELIPLRKKFGVFEKKVIQGISFYTKKVNDLNLVVICSGVGIVNMSSALSLALYIYSPMFVINYGLAGGFGSDVHSGDIVIGSHVMNIGSFQISNDSNYLNDLNYINFIADGKDELIYYSGAENLINLIDSNFIRGVIGSGDIWNKNKDSINYLNKKYGILCEDMESVAVYQVCAKCNVPCLSIKVISDNEVLGEEYDKNIISILNEFISNYILLLVDHINNKVN